MASWWMDEMVQWLAGRVLDLLGGLLAFLTSSMFLSPDVTALPQVTTIAGKSSLVVSACFVLAIIAAGVATMVSGSVDVRYTLKDLLPRLVVGLVMSHFAVPLCAALIDIANALTAAMVGTAAPAVKTVTMARAHVGAALTDPSSALIATIIGLFIVVLMFALVAGWVARVVTLVVLAGVAPVALACYATPWTQGVAGLWWRSVLACLGTPMVQAVTLSTGVHLLVDPDANLPVVLGLPGSDVLNLLLVAVLLWSTVRIPGMLGRYVTGKGSPSMGGVLLRAVFIQSVTRRLPLGRIGRTAARGGR
ncbi:conjugal transfer protein TrbL family protein [Micromonospora sp. NPDC050495]|uniref:conjugal transfer protein TrbL family protein n=1 Tax=Micromonospora sp. NPDC050495 TaxID=3154936 RepID=UPI0033D9097C